MDPSDHISPGLEALIATAEVLMRRRQWAAAAGVFAQIDAADRDVGTEMKHRLAANLAALQVNRPAVYDILTALPPGPFSVAATPSGRPTVRFRRDDGTVVSLSSGPDPLAVATATLPNLYNQTKSGEAVALCGLGDGYLASLLAQNPPTLFMDKRQPVYLIEPEPHVLLQCLMIHDYSDALGPIADARFYW